MSKFGTVKVSGGSMLPAYRDGDWLFVSWIDGAAGLAAVGKSIVGKVVVVERKERPGIFLVKRVQKFHSDKYWVEGDGGTGAPEAGVAVQAEFGATRGRDKSFAVDESRSACEAAHSGGMA